MKRVLFVLFAILTGLASTGTTAFAGVEARNAATAASAIDRAGKLEQATAAPPRALVRPAGARPAFVARALATPAAPCRAVQLKADRAHE